MTYWTPPPTCEPCRGTGTITLEDDQGFPVEQRKCEYCHGSGTGQWMAVKREQRLHWFTKRRKIIAALAVVLLLSGNLWPSIDADGGSDFAAYMFVLHLALFLALAFAWAASPPRRQVDPDHPRHHAPGFSDDGREARALGLFGAALGLRSMWDNRRR